MDGCFIVEGHVWAQEVIVCDDKSCEGNGAVIGFEAAAWADMEFKSSVKTFNELFKRPKFG